MSCCIVYLFNTELRILWVTHRSQKYSSHHFMVSSCNKADGDLWHDEVRFLIFNRTTENLGSQLGTGSPSQIIWAPYRVLSTYYVVLVAVYMWKFMSLVLNSISKFLSRPIICAHMKGLEINIYFYHFCLLPKSKYTVVKVGAIL
jgi:hypothetical protein